MDTRKTDVPHDIRIEGNNNCRQLTAIIHITKKWTGFLHHECNGLFGNINWISQMMLEQTDVAHSLPPETFSELNRLTQNNICVFKAIRNYFQVLNAVADKADTLQQVLILEDALFLNSDPRVTDLNYGTGNGLSVKVTSAFAKVLFFLLDKVLEIAGPGTVGSNRLNVSFNVNEPGWLHVCVSASVLFWHHDLWEYRISSSLAEIPADSTERHKHMFYEMLALVDGNIVSGCNRQRSFDDTARPPRLATELIQREVSAQYLEFSVPFGLEKN